MKKSIKNFIIITAVAMSAFAFGPTFAIENSNSQNIENIFQQTNPEFINNDQHSHIVNMPYFGPLFNSMNSLNIEDSQEIQNQKSTTVSTEDSTMKNMEIKNFIDPSEYEHYKKVLANLEKDLEHHKNSYPKNINEIAELEMIKSELSDLIKEAYKLATKINEQDKTIEQLEKTSAILKETNKKLKTKHKNP